MTYTLKTFNEPYGHIYYWWWMFIGDCGYDHSSIPNTDINKFIKKINLILSSQHNAKFESYYRTLTSSWDIGEVIFGTEEDYLLFKLRYVT